MPYISSSGSLQQSKSWTDPSIIFDFFWGIIAFIQLFFQTMFDPGMGKQGSSGGSGRHGGDDDSQPRRRMGGFRRNTGGVSPPPMAGGG